MAWSFVNDSFSKRPCYFNSLEDAVNYCQMMGKIVIQDLITMSRDLISDILLGRIMVIISNGADFLKKKRIVDLL